MKDVLIKRYYRNLVLSLLIFPILILANNFFGFVSFKQNVFIIFIAFILYYMIIKNILQNYYTKKICEIDEEYKIKEEERKKAKKERIKVMLPIFDKKWYRNTTLIYIIILLGIVFAYNFFN